MIIVSIIGPTMKEAFAQVANSARDADMFEFRLDMIHEPPMSLLFSSTKKPIIATCRPKWEGGEFEGSESERLGILEAASVVGADFIDVELNTERKLRDEFVGLNKSKMILSLHQLESKRIDSAKIYARMKAIGADVFKFAFMANDAADIRFAREFLNLARRDKQNAIAIAMGEFGEASRVLYKKFGGWGTYASSNEGKESALGQVSSRELKTLYRADSISTKSKVFGVIGNPLKQSKGIYLHNPLFQRAKANAVYCRFPVKNISRFMTHIAPLLSGFSVTLPHKQTVMRHVDRLDATAKAIGAVNTVVRRNGKWFVTNTDATGALDAIEKIAKVRNRGVLLIGAGGAARAIAFEAKRRGATVFIMNRNESKAKKLARHFGLYPVSKAQARIARYAFVVNATSVGMTPNVNHSPLPKSMLKGKIVFDAVYNPPMTKLLVEAKDVGAKIIQGTEMYLNQAALQSELYCGVKPTTRSMKQILATRNS